MKIVSGHSLFALPMAAFLAAAAPVAHAATIAFNTDPFAGSTALTTPGRQIATNNQQTIPFDIANDVAEFFLPAFDASVGTDVNFFNGLADDLPSGGLNVIVLKNIDFDGDPANGLALNAGQAATLIANEIGQAGAGFFVYFNTGLSTNRLVYSVDLADGNADLSVLARFSNQTGQTGIDGLGQFTKANFATTAVPEPATWAFMVAGFGVIGGAIRRQKRSEVNQPAVFTV